MGLHEESSQHWDNPNGPVSAFGLIQQADGDGHADLERPFLERPNALINGRQVIESQGWQLLEVPSPVVTEAETPI